MESLQKLSEIVDNFKNNLKENDYLTIMNELKTLHDLFSRNIKQYEISIYYPILIDDKFKMKTCIFMSRFKVDITIESSHLTCLKDADETIHTITYEEFNNIFDTISLDPTVKENLSKCNNFLISICDDDEFLQSDSDSEDSVFIDA